MAFTAGWSGDSPHLISVQPLPTIEGAECEWAPATVSQSLATRIESEYSFARFRTDVSANGRATINADRYPARIIRDTSPTYSAVAVDLNSNEVFLQDENIFRVEVFNRLENTPPTADFTEPKRVLGGIKTNLEFNCALYIDPTNGDIYSVNNDNLDRMVIFSREARGNVPPKRMLNTPHRTFGVAVDEEKQELYLTVQHPPQVVVYRKMASGSEKPIRVLAGDRTKLHDAHGIAIDTKNNLIFVSNHGSASNRQVGGSGKFYPPSITVYSLHASGDTSPLRVITGPKTELNWPSHLSLDAEGG